MSDIVSAKMSKVLDDALVASLDVSPADEIQSLRQRVERLEGALRGMLNRDIENTCQHEDTYRGGAIWEICCSCNAKWADDEGGKPEWRDPQEWDEARAALSPKVQEGE
jgi:hypothetical protein